MFTSMGSEFLSIIYGLASAASWGAGDFSGGFATKRTSVYSVIFVAQLVGGILLFALTALFSESISSVNNLLIGGFAGICGAIGLVLLYYGLATGQMGVVAPVTAVVAAIIPVTVGIFSEGFPPLQKVIGFGIAIIAVWLLSRGSNSTQIRLQDLKLPIAAGTAFGLFFILIAQVSSSAVLWPLVAARVMSVVLIFVTVTVRRQSILPQRQQLFPIFLSGIFDAGGNAFFALAVRAGRLDMSVALSSLYPAGTVLLAWLILKERLILQQWVGVGAALLALVLIAL